MDVARVRVAMAAEMPDVDSGRRGMAEAASREGALVWLLSGLKRAKLPLDPRRDLPVDDDDLARGAPEELLARVPGMETALRL